MCEAGAQHRDLQWTKEQPSIVSAVFPSTCKCDRRLACSCGCPAPLRCHFQESLPAFVAMITMPFTFSIGYGIIAGLGLWISIQLLLAPLRLYRGESPMVRVHKLWGSAFVEGDEEEKGSGKGTPSTVTPSQSFGEV